MATRTPSGPRTGQPPPVTLASRLETASTATGETVSSRQVSRPSCTAISPTSTASGGPAGVFAGSTAGGAVVPGLAGGRATQGGQRKIAGAIALDRAPRFAEQHALDDESRGPAQLEALGLDAPRAQELLPPGRHRWLTDGQRALHPRRDVGGERLVQIQVRLRDARHPSRHRHEFGPAREVEVASGEGAAGSRPAGAGRCPRARACRLRECWSARRLGRASGPAT